MKGRPFPSPIRDENPCRTCTNERHTACQDTCERRAKWVAEKDRVNENRRQYEKQIGIGIKHKVR